MPLIGKAIVAIWNDITAEKRDGFFEWHPREHMNERLGIPGFLRGRRYVALEAGIEFFTLYEAAGKEVLSGDSYKKRLNTPTPWSLDVLPGFRSNLRGVCDIVANEGYADGAILYTLRLKPADGREDALREALAQWCGQVVATPRVTGAQLAICDHTQSGTNTALQRGRTITAPDWVLLIEGSTVDGVATAAASLKLTGLLDAHGATGAAGGLYRMEYQVSRLTVAELPD